MLMTMVGHVSAQTGDAVKMNSKPDFSSERLHITGPKIVTDVVALTLKGKLYSEVLNIPDLDLYIDKAGRRHIPLLRLLRVLKATGGIEGGAITFSVSKGVEAQIDLRRKLLLVNSRSEPINIVTGVSDLTGQAEVFVPGSDRACARHRVQLE